MNREDVIARLTAVEPQLRAHCVAALYLFGSYARDEAHEDPDVDAFGFAESTLVSFADLYAGKIVGSA